MTAPPELDAFIISTFDTVEDTVPKAKTTTWPLLCKSLATHREVEQKEHASLWGAGEYNGVALRKSEHVLRVNVGVFEIDDGTPLETLQYWLDQAGLEYVIHSTYSSTLEHPKWRIVTPYVEPIPNAEYPATWSRINAHLFRSHLDPSTRDSSRMMFVPACKPGAQPVAVHHEGAPLDWRSLPPVPAPRPLPKPPKALRGHSDDQRRAQAFVNKWYDDLASAGDGRHNLLRDLCCAAGGLVASGLLDRGDVEALFMSASDSSGLVAKRGAHHVESTIRDGLDYGSARPWVPDDLPDSWRDRYLDRRPANLTSHATSFKLEVGLEDEPPTSQTSKSSLEVDAADLLEDGEEAELVSLLLLGQPNYFLVGWSHILAAYPRVGKTELLKCCAGAWLSDGQTILYLTEESRQVWRLRIRKLGRWPRGMRLIFGLGMARDELLGLVKTAPESIVIVDTIRNLLGLVDERDNSEVARVLNPFVAAARATDKTLIFSHHVRKGGGQDGEGIAGGHALLGAVDIGLELARDPQSRNRRRVKAYARLISPPDLIYEQAADGSMRSLGDPDQVADETLDKRLLEALAPDNDDEEADPLRWIPSREIRTALGEPKPSDEQVRQRLRALAERGLIERDPPITVADVTGKRVHWRRMPSEEVLG